MRLYKDGVMKVLRQIYGERKKCEIYFSPHEITRLPRVARMRSDWQKTRYSNLLIIHMTM